MKTKKEKRNGVQNGFSGIFRVTRTGGGHHTWLDPAPHSRTRTWLAEAARWGVTLLWLAGHSLRWGWKMELHFYQTFCGRADSTLTLRDWKSILPLRRTCNTIRSCGKQAIKVSGERSCFPPGRPCRCARVIISASFPDWSLPGGWPPAPLADWLFFSSSTSLVHDWFSCREQ